MNPPAVVTTTDTLKIVLGIIASVFGAIAALNTSRLAMRSKALEIYKQDVEALTGRCTKLEANVVTLHADLAAERVRSEALEAQVKLLQGRTDYTILETTVQTNIAELTQAVKTLTTCVEAMQSHCSLVHKTLNGETIR